MTVIMTPGQRYLTLRDGKPTENTAYQQLCVGPFLERKVGHCKNQVPTIRGIFEPRCPSCFDLHRAALKAAKDK